VAINKIDKPDSDPTRVVNELLQHEIVAESLGGETQMVEVSATQKTGLDSLVEAILLQAEVMDLRANPDRTAEGTVIEAKLDKGRGPVATVLVNRGTLKRGDIVVAGSTWGRVRAMLNERGEQVQAAGPSEPVEILGLDAAPSPGDALAVVDDEARARELTEYRERKRRESQATGGVGGASLADMMAKLTSKKISELPVVIKADVQGSAEAIASSLQAMGNEEVRARIIHQAVGGITESDVLLAKGSGAPIIGFNVRASKQARDLAEREGVEIRYYAIIYDLWTTSAACSRACWRRCSARTSSATPRCWRCSTSPRPARSPASASPKAWSAAAPASGSSAGRGGAGARRPADAQRFKDDVAEVTNGMECGMTFQGFQDIKVGDTIECFTLEQVARSL
jgi:translation initiation factor IF-2